MARPQIINPLDSRDEYLDKMGFTSNPLYNKDCGILALSKVWNIPYQEALRILHGHKNLFGILTKKLGFTYHSWNKSTYSFINHHPYGRYILFHWFGRPQYGAWHYGACVDSEEFRTLFHTTGYYRYNGDTQ